MGKRLEKLDKTGDRISYLPDEVLTYMLSLLSTKDVVRTSVLSKRWKPLWSCVPTLDLSDLDFSMERFKLDDVERRQAKFLTFIYEFLLRGNFSHITRICLRCSRSYDQLLVKSWVSVAKKKNIQELQIETFFHGKIYFCKRSFIQGKLSMCFRKVDPLLPNGNSLSYTGTLCLQTEDESIVDSWMCVVNEWNTTKLELDLTFVGALRAFPRSFTYDILVVLKLRLVFLNFPIASMCFPKLKVLLLSNIKFDNGGSASNLISSSCPLLEELEMIRCDEDNVQSLIIISQTLRRLIMGYSINQQTIFEFETTIDAPNLRYLALDDVIVGEYVFKDLSLLEEAKLTCIAPSYECLREILRKISCIKYLVLNDEAMWWLDNIRSSLPTFHNLISLKIDSDNTLSLQWALMEALLENSPKLKYVYMEFDDVEDEVLTSLHDVPKCLVTELETIELHCLLFKDMHREVVRYFLKISKVLKKMKIRVRESYMWRALKMDKERFKEEVLGFPKASSTCLIEFVFV